MRSLGWVVFALGLLGAVPARAAPPAPPPAPNAKLQPEPKPKPEGATVPEGDFRLALGRVQGAVAELKRKPSEAGLYGRREEVWHRYARPRASRLAGQLQRLARASLWVRAKPDGPAVALDPEAWGPLVRGVSSVFASLSTIEGHYRKVRVDGRSARATWLQRHPGPEPIGPTASEPDLAAINAVIRRYVVQGNPVPATVLAERDRLAAVVAEEQRLAREQKRREYEQRREQAYHAIEAHVLRTRTLLRDDVKGMGDQLGRLRALVAAAQEIEERRLQGLVARARAAGGTVPDAEELLAALAEGRAAALAFDDERGSRYGSLLRQKWLVPRGKLLKALEHAQDPPDK
jgi:hypothetical protein